MRQDPLGAWDKTAHCRAWLQGQFWPFQIFSGNKLREVWVDDPASLMEGGSHWLAGLIEMAVAVPVGVSFSGPDA